jgi:hypothetical protein
MDGAFAAALESNRGSLGVRLRIQHQGLDNRLAFGNLCLEEPADIALGGSDREPPDGDCCVGYHDVRIASSTNLGRKK